MTSKARSDKPKAPAPRQRPRDPRTGRWLLHDAKARFSELVRRVKSDGPQHVTVRGREEVVVISADEFRRLKGNQSGQALVDALAASPHRDIDLEPKRGPAPVRDLKL